MSIEVEVLLQEAKENIEAAQNYRAELQQRLHGLNQARKQVEPGAKLQPGPGGLFIESALHALTLPPELPLCLMPALCL